MAGPKENSFRNHMLAAMPAEELAILSRSLTAVTLPRRTLLELPGKSVERIYFPESGIVSIVAASGAQTQVEIGIIGREGMTGLAVVHHHDRSPYAAYMQIDGAAHVAEADAVREVMARSLACRRLFLGFAQAFLIQTAETAVANARANVEERLARWLLMAQDRVEGNEIPLTHEFLSLMMGARRPGVTEAVHELSAEGLIAGGRGKVTVLDRKGLLARAGRFYGVPEKELRRLSAL